MHDNNEYSPKPSKKMLKKSQTDPNSNVPDFIQKLFRMLENKEFQDVFSWDASGTSFLVKDTNEFSKTILPNYFKHCNFASFVRQLNKYDFHKVRNNTEENQRLYGDQVWEFEHSNFKRDRKDLLDEIKRKTPGKKKKFENMVEDLKSSSQDDEIVISSQVLKDLKDLTENLQNQINQLKKNQIELESTISKMSQKEKLILNELSNFSENLKAKDEVIKECLKLTQDNNHPSLINDDKKPVKMEVTTTNTTATSTNTTNTNTTTTTTTPPTTTTITKPINGWTEPSTQPPPHPPHMDNVLSDIFLPNPSTNTLNDHEQQQQQQTTHHVPKPIMNNNAIDKGKKKIIANWTKAPRVLLVDDDSLYRDVSGRMLNMMGCSIDLAKDGLEALQKLSLEKYDLILMDIVMPKMDGIQTTRNIRRYDTLTPIVSMTSNFSHNDIMEYIGIGMNDILPKPFSKNTLFDILEKHCSHLKLDSSPTNYPLNNNNTNTNNPSTSSSNSSPTIPIQDPNNYWQTLDNRKFVWSPTTSNANLPNIVQPSPQQPNKRQKLNDQPYS